VWWKIETSPDLEREDFVCEKRFGHEKPSIELCELQISRKRATEWLKTLSRVECHPNTETKCNLNSETKVLPIPETPPNSAQGFNLGFNPGFNPGNAPPKVPRPEWAPDRTS
jgi:hypothetical protein